MLIEIVSTALQRATPNDYRGRMSSLFLLFSNLVGFGLGPLAPAVITDYVFRNGAALGLSVTIVSFVTAPMAALLLWYGGRIMRPANWHEAPAAPTRGVH